MFFILLTFSEQILVLNQQKPSEILEAKKKQQQHPLVRRTRTIYLTE